MKTLTKVSILFTSILILLLQGCGNSSSSSKNYNTTLGESVAIGTTDENAVTLPNTNMVKSISQEISAILKSNVTNYPNLLDMKLIDKVSVNTIKDIYRTYYLFTGKNK